jgi:hypothetical protein
MQAQGRNEYLVDPRQLAQRIMEVWSWRVAGGSMAMHQELPWYMQYRSCRGGCAGEVLVGSGFLNSYVGRSGRDGGGSNDPFICKRSCLWG